MPVESPFPAQRETGRNEQAPEEEQGASPEQGAGAVRRCDRGAPARTATGDGKTECRPRIKGIWPAYHQLDLPLPHEAEQRIVEYIRAITSRRGRGHKFSYVRFQRTQMQLDLRGVPHRSAPTVSEGYNDTVGTDSARRDGERDAGALDCVLEGQQAPGCALLPSRHLPRWLQAGEDPHGTEDQYY